MALKAAAEQIAFDCDGVFPTEVKELVALPGIGPATAQGIRAFAFDLPGVYLETNVRTVVLHHLFPDVPSVPDTELVPIVEATCPAGLDSFETSIDVDGGSLGAYAVPQDEDDTPRSWYYGTKTIRPVLGITRCSITVRTSKRPFPTPLDALRRIRASRSSRGPVVRYALRSCACFSRRVNSGRGWMPRPCTRRFAPPSAMQAELRWSVSWSSPMLDYGAYLKKTVPNPSRRAKAYTRQSKFEGSRRQKRAEIVRMLLAAGELGVGMDAPSVHAALCASERDAGRAPVERELVESILSDLEREGFCCENEGVWRIA